MDRLRKVGVTVDFSFLRSVTDLRTYRSSLSRQGTNRRVLATRVYLGGFSGRCGELERIIVRIWYHPGVISLPRAPTATTLAPILSVETVTGPNRSSGEPYPNYPWSLRLSGLQVNWAVLLHHLCDGIPPVRIVASC